MKSSAAVLVYASVLWISSCIAARTVQNGSSASSVACTKLGHAMVNAMHGYIRWFEKEHNRTFPNLTTSMWIDFNDDSQIRALACKLVNVKSIKEAAPILHSSYNIALYNYQRRLRSVKIAGGFEEIFTKAQIAFDMYDACKKFNFPKFPLKNAKQLEAFLQRMTVTYGTKFLTRFHEDLKLEIVDTKATARILASAYDVDTVAKALNIDTQYLRKAFDYIVRISRWYENTRDAITSAIPLYRVADRLGFFEFTK